MALFGATTPLDLLRDYKKRMVTEVSPDDQMVLRFDEAQHDATDRYRRFTAERRAAGGETAAIYRSRVGAGAAKLDPVLRRVLRTTSGALLRDLGYLDGGR